MNAGIIITCKCHTFDPELSKNVPENKVGKINMKSQTCVFVLKLNTEYT